MGQLCRLINIGIEMEKQLNRAEIYTYEDLKEAGAKLAWLKIYAFDDSACIHRLYALEGAILNIKKCYLPMEIKADLKTFYQSVKGEAKSNKEKGRIS